MTGIRGSVDLRVSTIPFTAITGTTNTPTFYLVSFPSPRRGWGSATVSARLVSRRQGLAYQAVIRHDGESISNDWDASGVGKWKVEDPTTRKVMNAGPDMGKHDVRISSGSSDKVRKRPSLTYLASNY